jgi:hypothetical protein|tara:strand:- start:1289 stop:1837 length:549 start_codon:yes stop_codon:yes gene_type:complete
MSSKLFAALFASLAIAASAASAQQPAEEVLLQFKDGAEFAKVSRTGTTCTMLFGNEADKTAVTLLIGQTTITSQLYMMTTADVGANAEQFDFRRLTPDGIVTDRKAFIKTEKGPGIFEYASSLNALQIDFDDLQKTGGFLLTRPNDESAAVLVKFDGVARDRTIAAMGECLASLPSHWSLDG